MARRGALVLAIVAELVLGSSALVRAALAADPSRPPLTCEERYPDPGPAGLDLRLACIASELMGHYTGADSVATAPRISGWLWPIAAAIAGFAVIILAVRMVARRTGTRLASATPGAWWQCPNCRSLNPAGRPTCYRCRRPWDPEAAGVPTAADPETRQSFGNPRWFEDPREWRDPPEGRPEA